MMSRFEKKCFVGSAALHGLLLGTFLFSSAFLTSRPQISAASVITILPESTKAYGRPDGNPDPPAPAAQQQAPPQPQPEPPKPVEPPPKAEPVKIAEPVKERDVKKPEPVVKDHGELPVTKPQKKEVAQKNTETKPLVSKTVVHRTNELARLEREKAAAAREAADRKYRQEVAKWQAQRSAAIAAASDVVGGVGKSLSKSTVVTSAGIDLSGGTVSGNYGERLKAIYDARWTLSHDLSDDESVACVKVVVRRDGTIKSAIITQGSGNSAFDRSVRRALDSVQRVEAFPPEMKDDERVFTWRFKRELRAG